MIVDSNTSVTLGTVSPKERAVMTAPLDAAALWGELTTGETRIVAIRQTEHFVIAKLAHSVTPLKVAPRSWRLLECLLAGEAQKCVAIRMHLATSTVSLHAKTALRALGFDCDPSRAPVILYMLVQEARGSVRFRNASVTVLYEDGRKERFVCLPRPDRTLDEFLSPAEVTVARLRLTGAPSSFIGSERHTTSRTVANQLASTYRKLGVSGRAELICKLLSRTGDPPAPRGCLELALHLETFCKDAKRARVPAYVRGSMGPAQGLAGLQQGLPQ